ncbi:MAG: hypothetical protein RO257_09075 [Candidatus Kapabacteria bacterium]|nr:hypothetical protein [Candidatus Kapabacteria bacterium]
MAVSSEFREYKMTDGDLCLFTNQLCSTLTRNLADLEVFAITEEKISQLKAQNDEFKVFSQDQILLYLIVDATEQKKIATESIKNTLRNMALRCQMKWGSGSWQEDTLGIAGMNKFIDDTLLNASRRVHEKMTGFLSELADTGLTAEILDNFETLNNSFEFAINLQKDRINERRVKTSERITMGNELYRLVSKYCDIGKRVYSGRSPAHYNDFIIYSPTPGSIKVPEGLKL